MAVGKKPCPYCGGPLHRGNEMCRTCREQPPGTRIAPATHLAIDREKKRSRAELDILKAKYKEAIQKIEHHERDLETFRTINSGIETFAIEPKKSSKTSEATVVAVASDWHVEENVGAEVGGLNIYNLSIAKARAVAFFQNTLRLTNLLAQDVTISTMILALLGDFISGAIHDELSDNAEELPMHALTTAQSFITSGIEFLLKNSKLNFVIPCHSGNHARTTHKTHFSNENGHSLEYLMYLALANYFRHEKRIKFIVPAGMHSYVQVYDTTIRFQHGHAIKYGGGVGGIYVPVNKAIAQWNKGRHADLDAFGHFHQMRDGGNFICNGSMIGYSAFALSIKADFEKPKQALFLIDKKRGRTCTWPILFPDTNDKSSRAVA